MVGGVPSRRPTVHWPRDGDAASDHDEDRQEGPLEAESRTKDTTKGSGTKGSTKGSGTKHTTKAHPSDMNSRAASSLEPRDPQSATAEVTSPEVTSPASGAPIPLEAPTLRHGVLEICQIADGRAALRHGLQDGGAYGVGWEARRVDLEWCELMCACVHVCMCARVPCLQRMRMHIMRMYMPGACMCASSPG